jgi:phenol 2-monooxygenase (NADPH)
MIPDYCRPRTGSLNIPDLHKVFVDDEAYDHSHGYAYRFYGVNEAAGALAVIRPDQCIIPTNFSLCTH